MKTIYNKRMQDDYEGYAWLLVRTIFINGEEKQVYVCESFNYAYLKDRPACAYALRKARARLHEMIAEKADKHG